MAKQRGKPPATVSAAAAKLGSSGGLSRGQVLSAKRRQEIARKGGIAKAKKK